jgi:tetratricopeptide (TPR) repeat protein
MQAILVILLASSMAGNAAPAAAQAAPAARPDGTAAYYFLLGRHLEDLQKIDEAIAAHQKAIALAPESAELRAELAALYARNDRAREALDMAEAALKLDPANREANRILGTVYASLSEQRRPAKPGEDPAQYGARAIAALEKSRQDGFDINLELMLGRLYLSSRDYAKAIASLRKVVDDQPGYAEGAMLLAAAQEGAGQTKEQIQTLEALVETNPTFYRAYLKLAELYQHERRFADAADAYAHVAAANTRIDVTSQRAAALINAGKPAEARDILQAHIQQTAAPDAAVLYMLGQAQGMLKVTVCASATVLML